MDGQGLTSWVEVNLPALTHNLAEVRNLVGPDVRIMAVVKADAYGHGAVQTARSLAEAGANYFGVTTLEEGLELRADGICTPILVFSPLLPDQIDTAIMYDLQLTVSDINAAKAISGATERTGKWAMVHVKVDTGMGRLGIPVDECPNLMCSLLNLHGVEVGGIYTHFANAGATDLSHAMKQNARFSALMDLLASKDIPTGLRHASNSAAILNLPDARYDMVRAGTILYGQYPSRNVKVRLDLSDTWHLKTRIVALKWLPARSAVGYGSEFTTTRPTLSAVIAIGYSDGFTVSPESVSQRANNPLRVVASRLLGRASGPHVTIRGAKARVIGRVSMQMCSVDVTDIPGVQVGDEALVPSRRTTTSSRIQRVYVG